MLLKITILPGDGIGPEVTDEAVRVLENIARSFSHQLKLDRKEIGGAALLSSNNPLPDDTIHSCLASGAVLLGAVGGPSFDKFPKHLRPESGLLRLRRELGAFANLRPAVCFPALEDCSPLRPEVVRGTDVLIVRELLGGIYFGEPRSTQGTAGNREALDTMRYTEPEIERIARMAFELARTRRRKVTSVDKANVLDCSRLWRDVVTRVAQDYPDVTLSHMYVDSAAMLLVSRPADFDVLLTENMFGDISQIRRVESWVHWGCWLPRVSAEQWVFTNRYMVRRRTLPDAVSPILWAPFFLPPCCCDTPSSWKARRLRSKLRYPASWPPDIARAIWLSPARLHSQRRRWGRKSRKQLPLRVNRRWQFAECRSVGTRFPQPAAKNTSGFSQQ